MSEQEDNVFPDTVSLIQHARSLPDRPLKDRLTPYRNIGQLLTERAAAMPEKEWLAFYTDEGRAASMTYAEFEDRSRRLATYLLGPLQLRPGDRIATFMTNDARTVVIYFGA